MRPRYAAFFGGFPRPCPSAATFIDRDPATGEVFAEVEIAGATTIDAAVQAAGQAQRAWASTAGAVRWRILLRAASMLHDRVKDFVRLDTLDTGRPIQETETVDVTSGAEGLKYFWGLAGTLAGEAIDLGGVAWGYTRREPIGVVAEIGTWNYPLQIACRKAAPALACGNALIFNPAPQTPLTALQLAGLFKEAGLSGGLFNVVNGFTLTGQLLTLHPKIRKISLTGSVQTGKAVAAAAATLKRVSLEAANRL